MTIGIDGSRAFIKDRTGIEEYSYQVIKGLMNELKEHQVILYIRRSQKSKVESQKFPDKWKVKVIKWPYLWTQVGLSLEMLFHPADTLFIPAHTVPVIHPAKTIVAIHGLEYEFCPKAYSFWERIYMRFVIKNSCRWAKFIIAVSNNTKNDLIKLYNVLPEKIKVVYEGVPENFQFSIFNFQSNPNDKIYNDKKIIDIKYLLFVGRLEERKNISGIVEAFEILKEKYKIPHKLVLAGNPGFGFAKTRYKIQNTRYKNDIILKGFVSDDEKYSLLKNANIFLFPSFYEGFGLPILEAQSAGVPVVTSNVSSMPEITCHSDPAKTGEESQTNNRSGSFIEATQDDNYSALLVNPNSSEEIAEATFKLISDENLKNDIIKKGLENVKRFSWGKCAEEVTSLILDKK